MQSLYTALALFNFSVEESNFFNKKKILDYDCTKNQISVAKVSRKLREKKTHHSPKKLRIKILTNNKKAM